MQLDSGRNPERAGAAPREQASILIAEDDEDVRELLAFRLAAAGYGLIEAADGETALTLARELHPDLCVVDVLMPGIDGVELTRRLRGEAETAAIPVIVLTASVGEEAAQRALAAGATECMTKPFAHADLLERVAAALGRA